MGGPLRLAVLVSGKGSNLAAIVRATEQEGLPATVVVVVSDRAEAAALDWARSRGLHTEVLPPQGLDRPAYAERLQQLLERHRPDLIVLAGFMRILDPGFTERWSGRILNIHPSLLPALTGLHTHRRALEGGLDRHGCTVHFVTGELDGGPPVIQASLAVRPGEDEASLSARVQALEHRIFPEAIGWFAEGRLEMKAGSAWLDGQRLESPVMREAS
ncbi:MAG: phosphoribosylglycinamide formyltransferase [Steroidobacteraceae bacterium]